MCVFIKRQKNAAGPCLCRCLVSVRHAGAAGAARAAEKEAQEQHRLFAVRARGALRVAHVVPCGESSIVPCGESSSHKRLLGPVDGELERYADVVLHAADFARQRGAALAEDARAVLELE